MSHAKIVSLEIENVQRINAVALNPHDGMTVIGGNNGEGKTSLINSIAMALGGNKELPEEPLRRGAERGQIVVKTNNGLVIKRVFTRSGASRLEVTNDMGFKTSSPQQIIEKLTSAATFDPLSFATSKPAVRLQTLKALVGLDTTEIDTARAALYDARTAKNKEVAAASHRAAAAPHYANAPTEKVDASAILLELTEADAHNDAVAKAKKAYVDAQFVVEQREVNVSKAERAITDLEDQLAAAKDKLRITKQACAEAKADELAKHTVAESAQNIDTSPIRLRLAEAGTVNEYVSANARRAELVQEVSRLESESKHLTERIEKCDQERMSLLAAVQYPIDGLSISEKDVTLHGIPLDQASSAEKIRVSVAIGAALNPAMRVMLVRDGSLLDAKSLALLGELCVQHDLQLFVERVGEGKECSVIIEDGAIKSAEESEASE